jgi:hypothetical protein
MSIEHAPQRQRPSYAKLWAGQLFKVTKACEVSGIGRTKMFELLRSGAVPALRSGAATLVIGEGLGAHVDSLPTWKPDGSPYKPEVATAAREAKRDPAPKGAPRLGACESVAAAREAVGAARARAVAHPDPRVLPSGPPRDPMRDLRDQRRQTE